MLASRHIEPMEDQMDPLEEKRNGYSLADCAEIMNMHSDLTTQYGEPGFKPHFQQFLRSKGLTENQWAVVWNEWHEATTRDPALGAKFHTYMAQVRQRQLIAKQPDVTGETLGGLSLAQYAKISAQSQTGAAIEGLVAGEGLTMDQWLAGQTAWGQKMGQISPTDPIMLQYSQEYQKWAPNHQAMMEASTEAALSEGMENGVGVGTRFRIEEAEAHFGHSDIRVRSSATRSMIHEWERQENPDARVLEVTKMAYDEGLRMLRDGAPNAPGVVSLGAPPESIDIHAWSKAVAEEEAQLELTVVLDPMKDLASGGYMSAAQNEETKAAVQAAITRLEPRGAKVNELFPQIQDQLKQVNVRTLMDSYREALEELKEALDDWEWKDPNAEPEESLSDRMARERAEREATRDNTPANTGGILGILKSLPIIGNILRLLGL